MNHRQLLEELTSSSSPSIPNSPFSSPMVGSILNNNNSNNNNGGNIPSNGITINVLNSNGNGNGANNNNNNTNNNNITTTTTTTSTPSSTSTSPPSASTLKGKSSKEKSKSKLQQQQQLQQQQIQQLQQQLQQQQQQQQQQQEEDDDDDDEEDTSKVGKGEKQKARRTNQNIASRNYRQRKKVYIKEMEEKISSLTLENDSLKKDLYKIGNNPLELLKFSQEIVFLMTQIRRLVFQIDQALRNSEPDSSIKSLLNIWQSTMDQANSINEREIERFVHPYTQAKLTVMGYKPLTNPWTDFIKSPGQEEWWIKYSEKANLSAEQVEQINNLWAKFGDEEHVLQKELTELDEYIKKFFLTKIIVMPDNEKLNDIIQSCLPIPENQDSDILQTSEVLEFIYNLEKLKQKFIRVHRLTWETSKQMSKYLTVRQEAFLLVLVHSNTKYIHTNMDMTNNLWNQLNHNALAKTPSTYLLSSIHNNPSPPTPTNNNNNNSIISSPTFNGTNTNRVNNLLGHGISTPISSSTSTPQQSSTISASTSISDSINTYAQIPHMVQPQQSQPSNMFNTLPGAKPLKNQQPIDELFFGTIPLSQVPISFQQNSNMALFSNYRSFTQQQQQTTTTTNSQLHSPIQTQPIPSPPQQINQHIHAQNQQSQHQIFQSTDSNPILSNEYIYSFGNSIDGTNNGTNNGNGNGLHNLTDIHELRSEMAYSKGSNTTLPTIVQSLQATNNPNNNNNNNNLIFSQQQQQHIQQQQQQQQHTSSIPSSQSHDPNLHFHYYQPIQQNNQNNQNN